MEYQNRIKNVFLKNKKGPNTEPFGTPQKILKGEFCFIYVSNDKVLTNISVA